MIRDILKNEVARAVQAVFPDTEVPAFTVDRSENFGDFATSVALSLAGRSGKNPREVAGALKSELERADEVQKYVSKLEVAGPGFLNFYLKDEVFTQHVAHILENTGKYAKNTALADKKVAVEYTDPNPFKELHIGHFLPNVIGESLSRILEHAGAEMWRVNYQGDVGMHVAKAVWGMRRKAADTPSEEASLSEKMRFLGRCYADGANAFENEEFRSEIEAINAHVYEKDDEEVNRLYALGRAWSLDYFETIYERVGTKFDHYFFESETGPAGKQLVEEYLEKGIFERSDGAVIFPGEKYGLHDRVFINSKGLPTYEAKELALAKIKYDTYPHDMSYIVTAHEQSEYFKVILCAQKQIFPDLAQRTRHIANGMLRLPEGKMSSRTGKVIAATVLLDSVAEAVREKMTEAEKTADMNTLDVETVVEKVAVAAIKFTILRQTVGKDMVYDEKRALSFEGDSGPYLLYTYARTRSVLEKARESGVSPSIEIPESAGELERALFEGLPEALVRSQDDLSPHHICRYLLDLASAFNSYYAVHKILGEEHTPYRLALTAAVSEVVREGLDVLGIPYLEKM